jgi:uncharacterized membrane protein
LIELFIAFIVGMVLGYVIRGEQSTTDDSSQSQIEKLNEDVIYYKKLTTGLVEENADMRTRLRKHGEKYE